MQLEKFLHWMKSVTTKQYLLLLLWIVGIKCQVNIKNAFFTNKKLFLCDGYNKETISPVSEKPYCASLCVSDQMNCIGFCYDSVNLVCSLYKLPPHNGSYDLFGHRFFFRDDLQIFDDAEKICAESGYTLALAMNAAQLSYVKWPGRSWIGVRRIGSDPTYRRISDGVPVIYLWGPGQPDRGTEECGEVMDNMLFNDRTCTTSQLQFYCQFPPPGKCLTAPYEQSNPPESTFCFSKDID